MATGKRFYWLKLKKEFMQSEIIDFLMSQKNGAEYVVLYQMLCIACINTCGIMASYIGEIIIPFDVDKIQRECKYFKRDTVIVALELFKKIGLIYEEKDGCLAIADFEYLVGSETDYAAQKKAQRRNKIAQIVDNDADNDVDNVHTEIRDKRSENRDKEKDIDNKKDNVEKSETYKAIIDYLNKKSSSHYKHTTKATQRIINGRLKEGFTVDDFKRVIDIKSEQWLGDKKMQGFLRPETLFAASHFESYLNEARASKKPEPKHSGISEKLAKETEENVGFSGEYDYGNFE